MRAARPTRVHPCLPVPAAEQRRLALAAHLALDELRHGAPPTAWLDLAAATELALRLLTPDRHEPAAIEAAWGAHRALHGYAEGRGSVDAAVAASAAFLGVFESVLQAANWRRLIDAQVAMAESWARHGCIPDWPTAG